MSSSLESAFNFMCSLKKVDCKISRGAVEIDVQITPTNYARKTDSLEDTVAYGRQYLIPRKFFDGQAIPFPKRGDILVGTYLEEQAIGEVEELYNLGGKIFGWRVKTE